MARRGFTLIEIMLATAILGIIMLTVYGVLARALFAKNHSEERAELYASGREAVLKIADELEGALPPTAGRNIGFIGIPGTGRTPSDAVQFAVVVRRLYSVSENRGGRALVSYSLDQLQNTRSLFALRRQEQLLTEVATDDDMDTDSAAPSAPAPVAFAAYILDQVAGLRFRYLNPQSGEWADSWDTSVQVPTGQPPIGLPGAVEVTLFLADNDGGVHDFSTIVDLPLYAPPPTPGAQR
jgi:prepilin-type N-terminal cleavage/methylation domain-containing protein